MEKKIHLTKGEKDLIRRYLLWCYKTTKEELDKIDRYFTQLKADAFVLLQLRKSKEYKSSVRKSASYKTIVEQFQVYMADKEAGVLKKKYKNGKHTELNPGYQYLKKRFLAIEKALEYFLGKNDLNKICNVYEEEMTNRILQARDQH